MAGLTTNIVTSRNRAFPEFPSPNNLPEGGFYLQGDNSGFVNAPGFANDDAVGSMISIDAAGSQLGDIYYKNLAGSNITSGVWNGGMTRADAAGSSNADWWVSFYMDATDNVLYMLTVDRDTSPKTLYLSKVDKAGTVTAIGNQAMAEASVADQTYWEGAYMFNMRRTGGDGSGDFVIYNTNSAGGTAAAGTPYKGTKMTIAVADGSITYANMLPDASGSVGSNPTAFGQQSKPYGGGLGPTANGMMCGLFSQPIAGGAMHAGIWNINNGKFAQQVWVTPMGGQGPIQSASSMYWMYWRGKILMQSYSVGYGGVSYNQDEVENWLDEIGVYYGLL